MRQSFTDYLEAKPRPCHFFNIHDPKGLKRRGDEFNESMDMERYRQIRDNDYYTSDRMTRSWYLRASFGGLVILQEDEIWDHLSKLRCETNIRQETAFYTYVCNTVHGVDYEDVVKLYQIWRNFGVSTRGDVRAILYGVASESGSLQCYHELLV